MHLMKFLDNMKNIFFISFLCIFVLFFICFGVLELLKNESFFIAILSIVIGIVFFIFLGIKIISLGRIKIKENIIEKNILKRTIYLNIDKDFKIKYGIYLIQLINKKKRIFLEKNETSYNLIWDIYRSIKDQNYNNSCNSINYRFLDKPTNILMFPLILIITICLLTYIFILNTWIFIVSPAIFLIIIVMFIHLVSEETQVMDKSIINTKFSKSKKYNITTLHAVRLDVLQLNFKLYIRFYFSDKQLLISTTGYKASYFDFVKLFEIFNIYYNYTVSGK